MKVLRFSAILFALAGCSTPPPTQQELAAADYGPPPKNFQGAVLSFMQGHLRDPDSARYNFYQKPVRGYAGRERQFGWAACVAVNAKNGFGGYTGSKLYFFLMRGERITYTLYGDGRGGLVDRDIYNDCAELDKRQT